MNRSRAQRLRHLRERNPNSVCWRCSRAAVTTETYIKGSDDIRRGVCYQHSDAGKAESKARGLVQAAASDLLAACKALVREVEGMFGRDSTYVKDSSYLGAAVVTARAAIAKAEGR